MRLWFVVVLVACSNTPRERAPIASSPDAMVVAGMDAAPAVRDAATTDAVQAMRCRDVNGPSERFPKCTEDGKVVELARPIVLAIQGRTATAQGTSISVDGGARRGIDKTWRATILDARQAELVEATLTKLDPDRIEVLAPIAIERVDNFARGVRFTPPANTRLVLPVPPKREPVVLKIARRGAVTDRGTVVVVAGGTRQGIDTTWRAEVLDAQQRPLRLPASFARLGPDEIELVVRLTPDELDARGRAVRFTPP